MTAIVPDTIAMPNSMARWLRLEAQHWPHLGPKLVEAAQEIERLQRIADRASSAALDDVAAERSRQVSREGWTLEHDDSHDRGEMAFAAACYVLEDTRHWPWDMKWWKPKNRRRDLVRAAALLVAEIERLDRTSLTSG